MALTEKRSSGILLHITSLPSPFGIGDVGPEAFDFAEFLYRSKQHYWQILPLTPIQKEQFFSPYSSNSSMAGNTLLISPEFLAEDGLLTAQELPSYHLSTSEKVDYDIAIQNKNKIFEKAYKNFQNGKQETFEAFIHREAFWLDDFALFMVLKDHFKNKPWHQWPDEFKNRKLKSLIQFTEDNQEEIQKVKWLQFIFFQQWKQLKNHCNDLNIKILGDLPFYINHDSVDVWSRPELFELKKDGSIKGVAGVPPDYFNENGQLWGMPVYRWEIMADQRYDWWLKRIRKNLELVDVLRLDHFRAFAEYWEVPSEEKTAIHGEWKPGPGSPFFKVMKQEFGKLPFVAEDLGDIGESVHQLRDEFNLPGMKVLQFAFGKDMAESEHIPHNFTPDFFAYTGTHDNNTTQGWFQNELSSEVQKQIGDYVGNKVTSKNVHLVMSQLAQSSVAKTVIIPMQDVFGLDEEARMNTPASTSQNWLWRLTSEQITMQEEKILKTWSSLYHRDQK